MMVMTMVVVVVAVAVAVVMEEREMPQYGCLEHRLAH